ncbi:hypothetical protein FN846DRAFT_890619 [Sphaerosporella brunnea]|uniref:Uncharacterized protein n=1 Tax=Sphaerosporella brunnea TaxID=1250544 RepID=A0A5J5EW88_9PEZI|nr:hypothetical protein FN846DRAFT_890619 [Sphaerosporella brunnea]
MKPQILLLAALPAVVLASPQVKCPACPKATTTVTVTKTKTKTITVPPPSFSACDSTVCFTTTGTGCGWIVGGCWPHSVGFSLVVERAGCRADGMGRIARRIRLCLAPAPPPPRSKSW